MNKLNLNEIQNILTPPGNGVFTVKTAEDIIQSVQSDIYQNSDKNIIFEQWRESLLEIETDNKKPLLLGVCSDCGGGIHRGANWGPLFVRKAIQEISGRESYLDVGDIRVNPHLLHDKYLNEDTIENCRDVLFSDENKHLPVSPLSLTEYFCDRINELQRPKKIFAIGGDHSVSYPLVRSWIRSRKKLGKKVAIIHFDAHTDLMSSRQGIDYCFATWAFHILEDLGNPKNLIQLGIRSSGQPKKYWEEKIGVQQFWSDEITTKSIPDISQKIINHLTSEEIDELYVSFDIDAIDEKYASATGTPEPNGLSPEMPQMILAPILEKFQLTGADMVEVAPWVARDMGENATASTKSTLLVAASISNYFLENLSK
jgi:agmatinase